ncbi:AgmX/PglI C-terminal domain-containing protein [Rubrivivax albus]|uniref:Energy transducer TonB n=1 Tax=Rubrivivax albus TaxID=2499835 RepID=A0A437JSU0_9BURK|nr:AgmX/PglI C-terminal domain-containing protein [Rubrivivax albus]RVT50033.1 energy transducer TonB [Rubrivivax albus]
MTAAVMPLSFRDGTLPWAGGTSDDRRFRRIQQWVIGIALVVCAIVPWLPVHVPPPPPPAEPVRTAKLLLPPPAATPLAKPVPPKPAPKAEAPKPAPTRVAEKPHPAPASVAEARNPVKGKPPGEDLQTARQRAQGVGLLAMKDQLQQVAGAPVAVQLQADIKPGPGIGSSSGPGVGAGTEAGIPTRSMITAAAARGSGGLAVASGGVSRDSGGGGLAGRSTTLVEGRIGGGGGGGPGGGAGGGRAASGDGTGSGAAAAGGSVKRSGSGKASRSIEEIRLVFERHKGAIYALYNRALREDPSLQGKVVLELRIAPDGAVTGIRMVSSELKSDTLESKLLARVRQFDFGAKDVEVMVVNWPVDFLPS